MTSLALIAGEGRLPAVLAGHLAEGGVPPRILALAGFVPDDVQAESFRVEKLGSVIAGLLADGIGQVAFAGAVRRPPVDPGQIDAATMPLVPRLMAAAGQGDDHLLRTVIAVFEEAGLTVRGPAELMPSLVLPEGPLVGTPGPQDRADAARARTILEALGPLDLGQACVVARGHCLAIETLPGTAAMLAFTARSRTGLGGVMAKRPKPEQDMRIDMPVIGPETVAQAAEAHLSGLALAAGGVIVLDREAVVAAAEEAGLAIWAEP